MRSVEIVRWPLGVVLGLALTWAAFAVAQQEDSPPAAEQPAAEQPAEQPAEQAAQPAAAQPAEAAAQPAENKPAVPKLKIFELKHRTPQEMAQILAMGTRPAGAPGFGAPPMPAFGPAAGGQSAPIVAADSSKKLVFVRGTDEQLQQVEKIVQAFDVAEGDFQSQQLGNLHLIKVKDGNAGRVHGILSQLQLHSQMLHLGKLSLIALPTGDSEEAKAAAQQAQEVIAKLEADEAQAASGEQAAAAKPEEAKAEEAKAEEAKKEEAKQEEEKKPDEEKAEEKKEEEKKEEEKKEEA